MRVIAGLAAVASGVLMVPLALAHVPVFECFKVSDKVTCEGGFQDGGSAAGIGVKVFDTANKLLLQGKLDKDGHFSFAKPAGEFHVLLDAGASHSVTVSSASID
jgi:hypothetical protein